MIELGSEWAYVAVVGVALGIGAIGGLAGALIQKRDGESGLWQRRHRVDGKTMDWGGVADMFVGAVAGAASLILLDPTMTTGTGASAVTELDVFSFVGTVLIVGSAGAAVIEAAQSRVMSAINATKAEAEKDKKKKTEDVGKKQTEKAMKAASKKFESEANGLKSELKKLTDAHLKGANERIPADLVEVLRQPQMRAAFSGQENVVRRLEYESQTPSPLADLGPEIDDLIASAQARLDSALEVQAEAASDAITAAAL